MISAKRIALAVPLAVASASAVTGCGGAQPVAASTPDQLHEAQKLRAASLKGEGEGAAPRFSPAARRATARR